MLDGQWSTQSILHIVQVLTGFARQMELQMTAICQGTQTRNDVVRQNLERYRAVFARTTQEMDVLKAVSVEPLLDIRLVLIGTLG